MKHLTILLLLVVSSLWTHCGPSRRESAYCEIGAERSVCDGKLVKVISEGEAPMMQHPRISMGKVESYWNVNGSAWIFVSDASLDCHGKVEAIGILKTKVGPCDSGAQNKNMYCGTALYVQNWRCL